MTEAKDKLHDWWIENRLWVESAAKWSLAIGACVAVLYFASSVDLSQI
jgi:hypothetical protein